MVAAGAGSAAGGWAGAQVGAAIGACVGGPVGAVVGGLQPGLGALPLIPAPATEVWGHSIVLDVGCPLNQPITADLKRTSPEEDSGVSKSFRLRRHACACHRAQATEPAAECRP